MPKRHGGCAAQQEYISYPASIIPMGLIMVSFSFQCRLYEWGRTLKQHISTAGFEGCVPTDAPTSEKSG